MNACIYCIYGVGWVTWCHRTGLCFLVMWWTYFQLICSKLLEFKKCSNRVEAKVWKLEIFRKKFWKWLQNIYMATSISNNLLKGETKHLGWRIYKNKNFKSRACGHRHSGGLSHLAIDKCVFLLKDFYMWGYLHVQEIKFAK